GTSVPGKLITIQGMVGTSHTVSVASPVESGAATFMITSGPAKAIAPPVVTLSPAEGPARTQVLASACRFQYTGMTTRPDLPISVDGVAMGQRTTSTCSACTSLFRSGTSVPGKLITIQGMVGTSHTVSVASPVESGAATFMITSGPAKAIA